MVTWDFSFHAPKLPIAAVLCLSCYKNKKLLKPGQRDASTHTVKVMGLSVQELRFAR